MFDRIDVLRWEGNSAETIESAIATASAEMLLFADERRGAVDVAGEHALAALAECPDAVAALVPYHGSEDLEAVWRTLPAPVAMLATPPENDAAIAIRRAGLDSSYPLRDVDAPLHDLLIRSTAGGSEIAIAAAVPRTEGTTTAGAPMMKRPDLTPQRPGLERSWLLEHLRDFDLHDHASVRSADDAVALKAGLLQLHDWLDESHQLSQGIEGRGLQATGDYWHGIMHRREPDYGNSKYWFRRVGRHPVFGPLAKRAATILAACDSPTATSWKERLSVPEDWDPFAFVDFCAEADAADAHAAEAARHIQWAEMLLLFVQTWTDASGD